MTHTRPWPIPVVGPDGVLVNHVSDTHFGYRPWSFAESDGMLQDYHQGLIPLIDLLLHTGDITDGQPGADVSEDTYALDWLDSADLYAGTSLWTMGNHDIRNRPVHTRAKWESIYGRSANTYVDVKGIRFVTFTVDDFSGYDSQWIVPAATWDWVATVAEAHNGPVVIANHYPPTELGGVSLENALLPQSALNTLVGDVPNIIGMMCGHMHKALNDLSAASFVTLGGRQIPVLTDISSMLSDIIGRDYSAQMQSTSAYVTIYPDRWEIRYRRHGSHAWGGPADQRLTTMNLATSVVSRGM